MTTQYGVTAAGFVLKPFAVITDELAQRQRADIDPEWNTDSDSLAGQYNGIIADAISQVLEQVEGTYHALDRDSAIGASLDIIGSLSGTRRRAAIKSAARLTLNINAGTTVLAGAVVSVAGNPSIRVVTLEDATNSSGVAANVTVDAAAQTAGAAMTAVIGTLTTIETPVAGWNSVTNAEPLGGGDDIETDVAYHRRQLVELAAAGGGTVPGLRADLLHIPGVDAALVLENVTDAVVDGMPAHSFECIVFGGGDDAVIAQTIWSNKPAGVRLHGATAVTLTDEQGFDQVARFTRPAPRVVYVAIAVDTEDGYAGDVAVKSAVAATVIDPDSAGFLGIGTDVYAGRIICAAIEVAGVLNARVGLSFTSITDPDAGALSLVISDREIASLPAANIKVTSS